MKYFSVVHVLFLICLANVSISLDVDGKRDTEQPLQQQLQQQQQETDQLTPQEVHQLPSPEFTAYRKSATLPSYWLPLLYHLKQKRAPESNIMQQFDSEGMYEGSDVTDDSLSSRLTASGVTGVREDDLLDRLSLAETNEPLGVSNRRYSELSASIPRYFKWSRNGRYARQSRKPDAGKLAPFAAGNQHVVSFIQELFGSKDGRGVRFGLS